MDRDRAAIESLLRGFDGHERDEYDIRPGSEDGDHFLGLIYRVSSRAADGGGLRAVVKKVPESSEMRRLIPLELMYERELWAYSIVLPRFAQLQSERSVPEGLRFRHAEMLTGRDEMLALEDLSAKGFRLSANRESMDGEHLRAAVEDLARLHACSLALASRRPAEYSRLVGGIARKHEYWYHLDVYLEKLRPAVLQLFEHDRVVARKLDKVFDDGLKDFAFFLNSERSEPHNVICHGDFWSNNLMFAYDEIDGRIADVRMLDWQCVRHASPVTDLAYLLFTSLDGRARAEHLERSLDAYYEELRGACARLGFDAAESYPEAAYRRQIGTHLRYGLIVAIMVLPMTLADPEHMRADEVSGVVVKQEEGGLPVVMSKLCRERMAEVIEDFVKLGYI